MQSANLLGQQLGGYEIRESIGTGGMGTVYRAFQTNLKREVAIKVLNRRMVENSDFAERFSREAQTIALLEHPYIVPIYDYGTEGDIAYVVMRLLKGGSLHTRMSDKDSTLTLSDTDRILSQVASALDYAHKSGVIHRDIKPSNVLFDNHDTPFLVDFGIAKLLDQTNDITSTGVVMGTPTFMAPEQWMGDEVTPASDQYALGVVIFYMLTGQTPFNADTSFGMMYKHLHDPPPSLCKLRPDLPETFEAVLNRALSKNPGERFPSVAEFAREFHRAIADMLGHGDTEHTVAVHAVQLQHARNLLDSTPRTVIGTLTTSIQLRARRLRGMRLRDPLTALIVISLVAGFVILGVLLAQGSDSTTLIAVGVLLLVSVIGVLVWQVYNRDVVSSDMARQSSTAPTAASSVQAEPAVTPTPPPNPVIPQRKPRSTGSVPPIPPPPSAARRETTPSPPENPSS